MAQFGNKRIYFIYTDIFVNKVFQIRYILNSERSGRINNAFDLCHIRFFISTCGWIYYMKTAIKEPAMPSLCCLRRSRVVNVLMFFVCVCDVHLSPFSHETRIMGDKSMARDVCPGLALGKRANEIKHSRHRDTWCAASYTSVGNISKGIPESKQIWRWQRWE